MAGAPLGFDAEQCAWAALQIVHNQMADAIRLMTIKQGYDVREFTLFAYGGAGPMHASVTHLIGSPIFSGTLLKIRFPMQEKRLEEEEEILLFHQPVLECELNSRIAGPDT